MSGDVAFSGNKTQYEDARAWLENGLCVAIGGDASQIWCVPGNHDVDQSVILQRPSFQDVRLALRTCEPGEVDILLARHLKEAEKFYAPLDSYNQHFAEKYDCESTIERPVWTKDFPLQDGSTLRIYGLNSTLLSDDLDHFERGRMVLGQHQCILHQGDGIENLAMCHHPPDWLRDCDAVEQTLNPRTFLQLFGHKHKHRLVPIGNMLRIGAGAVQPSRSEPDWEPRYNWFTLEVKNDGTKREMVVEVHPRIWNKDKQRFTADYQATEGQESVSFPLTLKPYLAAPMRLKGTVRSESGPAPVADVGVPAAVVDNRGTEVVDPERTLARRYLVLGYVNKVKIATELDLHNDMDDQLSTSQRQRQHLVRAKQKGKACLAKLWELVEKVHGDGRYPTNPFA